MQDHATTLAADPASLQADALHTDPAATPQGTAAAPQPIDAELLGQIGGAGMLYAPVNRW